MNKKAMVEALVSHYTNGNKAQFANILGVSAQTISAWIARSTLDAELVFTKCSEVSAEWLLTGNGSMLRNERPAQLVEPIVIYKSDPKDAALTAAKDEIIAAKDMIISTLQDRIKDLEAKLHDRSVGLRTAPAADTPSVGGSQTSPK